MALTMSSMQDLGSKAPDFMLKAANPGIRGKQITLDSYADSKALVVMFICNHCPFVKTIEERLLEIVESYQASGVEFVGICSNDPVMYPEDNLEAMSMQASSKNYTFAYLQDLGQEIAKTYGAVCTPDFFVYDDQLLLIYRGRLDDGRPGVEPSTSDLTDALDLYLKGEKIPEDQIPSMGCNIKWSE